MTSCQGDGTTLQMKILSVFFWISVISFGALAQTSLQGYVVRSSSDSYFFTDSISHRTFAITPAKLEVSETLSKLSTFDSIQGRGQFGPRNTVILEAIDFVSLRRLLGTWKAPGVTVKFVDYSRVNFQLNGDRQSSEFSYVLSPVDGNFWKIFFTDRASVALGSINVENDMAKLEINDSQTGEITQRFNLKKIESN